MPRPARSPADRAGLREKDIITEIDGTKIEKTSDLFQKIRSHKPGDEVSIAYLRDGKYGKADVELGESENAYFLGSLDSDAIFPKLKVGNKLSIPDKEDLKKQFENLQDEFKKLRKDLDELKDDLKD